MKTPFRVVLWAAGAWLFASASLGGCTVSGQGPPDAPRRPEPPASGWTQPEARWTHTNPYLFNDKFFYPDSWEWTADEPPLDTTEVRLSQTPPR